MKKSIYIFLFLLFYTGCILAQENRSPIVDDLNTPKSGQGTVRVMQDESIKNLLATYAIADTTAVIIDWNTVNHVKVNGFKIQVFSGNNQKKSKDEAERKLQMVRESFPGEEASITYNAPFWRVRVGNFLTRADAEEVLKEMKKTFPSFGREMYIIENVPVKRIIE